MTNRFFPSGLGVGLLNISGPTVNWVGSVLALRSHVEPLRTYIATQEEHHRTVSFQDELRGLLKKYGLEWDERYVWD